MSEVHGLVGRPAFLVVLADLRIRLDFALKAIENKLMELQGRVQNGVVVLDGGSALPEGAAVIVLYSAPIEPSFSDSKKRIQVPLVHGAQPGSVSLTGAQIGEILDAEDAAPRR